jgi:glycosyltransferase involved in cell wall biosynthesis
LSLAKNYPVLIRAMAAVHAQTGARLVILGEGQERARLTAEIGRAGLARVIDLPGYKENPFAFMKRSDVFVLCSAWEGLPVALVEAMALGTPVVSTDCPSGPAEILEGGRWGRLVPVDDEAALAAAIVETLRSPARDAGLARSGDFALDKIIQEYAEVLAIPV